MGPIDLDVDEIEEWLDRPEGHNSGDFFDPATRNIRDLIDEVRRLRQVVDDMTHKECM